jgi:hypothetical protein
MMAILNAFINGNKGFRVLWFVKKGKKEQEKPPTKMDMMERKSMPMTQDELGLTVNPKRRIRVADPIKTNKELRTARVKRKVRIRRNLFICENANIIDQRA